MLTFNWDSTQALIVTDSFTWHLAAFLLDGEQTLLPLLYQENRAVCGIKPDLKYLRR